MNIFHTEYNLPIKTLQSINRARCHLQVFSLADLGTGNGTKIRHQYMLGLQGDLGSTWEGPVKQLSAEDIKAWKSAMKLLVNDRNHLKYLLERWLAQPHQQWQWYYSATDNLIFHSHHNSYTSYYRGRSDTRTNQIFFRSNTQTTPCGRLSLATMQVIGDTIILFEGTD